MLNVYEQGNILAGAHTSEIIVVIVIMYFIIDLEVNF